MALKIVHTFISPKADGPDSTEVKPSDWNAEHDVETDGAGGMVVGRDTSGPGPLQELPLAYGLVGAIGRWIFNVTGSLGLPRGTTAQRPGGANGGEIRWNTDIQGAEIYDGASWQPIGGLQTGMVMGWYPNVLPTGGWLFLNGQTIGRAGADHSGVVYQPLYTYLWVNVPTCRASVPASTGDPNNDWNANKPMTLPDECGAIAAGANTMGGIPSKGVLTTANSGVDGDTIGAKGGAPNYMMTADQVGPHTHKMNPNTDRSFNNGGGQTGGGSVMWDSGQALVTDIPQYTTVQQALIVQNTTIIRNSIIKV